MVKKKKFRSTLTSRTKGEADETRGTLKIVQGKKGKKNAIFHSGSSKEKKSVQLHTQKKNSSNWVTSMPVQKSIHKGLLRCFNSSL